MNRNRQFLTQAYYEHMIVQLDASRAFWDGKVLAEDYPGQGEALRAQSVKDELFFALLLKYTAGEPFERLVESLVRYVDALEEYQKRLANSEQEPSISPLSIEDELSQYEEFIQVVSLCILLFRKDLLLRVLALTDNAGYEGDDLVYESIVARVVERGRCDDGWYHPHYSMLIQAMDCATDGDQVAATRCLSEYCEAWYEGFEHTNVPWFDTHSWMTDHDGAYFGYWAFEAGAYAYLFGIEDSQVSSMVYPRDLVAYARSQKPTGTGQ